MSKHTKGSFLNTNGMFYVPAHETVRQTGERLAEGDQLKWPGSISIHGHMKTPPGISKRKHERTEKARKEREPRKAASLPRSIEEQFIADARLYADADKSDPFAFSRAMSHMKVGIGRIDGSRYFARATTEQRTLERGMVFSDGSNTYPVTVYRDVQRP